MWMSTKFTATTNSISVNVVVNYGVLVKKKINNLSPYITIYSVDIDGHITH